MRFLRSRKKRANLYLEYNGLCAICGKDLEAGWNADHKIPYHKVKCTELSNMQPLCPECNSKKGGLIMQVKNNEYFENLNLAQYLDIQPFRIGQRGAFNRIVERVKDKKKSVSVVVPTRYGKSDVIRASAIELQEQKAACHCLIASPCLFLRNQMASPKKNQEMVNRYSIRTSRQVSFDTLDTFNLPMFQNDEYYISITTQMLSANINEICR
jgi:superfamily II DNA helicase RecQ